MDGNLVNGQQKCTYFYCLLLLFDLNHMNILSFQEFSNYCEYKSYYVSVYLAVRGTVLNGPE